MDISQRKEKLQEVLNRMVNQRRVFGTSFSVKTDSFTWHGVSGNFSAGEPYFIASTTKLFTTALILCLKAENKLSLEDTLLTHMPHAPIRDLHIYRGKNHTKEINLRHLLSHTSGLPDYFQDKDEKGKSFMDMLLKGVDRSLSYENIVEMAKTLPPHFAPGTPGRAHYSDTNFQLLGRVIENITSKSFAAACHDYIIAPLGLSDTYLFCDVNDKKPKNMFYKKKVLNIPGAMKSAGPDGGMVSTSGDMLVFLEAFFKGKLFPKDDFPELMKWNPIFPPLSAGVGLQYFKLPWYFNPTGVIPAFVGHSGLSGALAFYCPDKDFFFCGTVNQIASPDLSFRTMIKLAQVLLKN